MGQWSMDMRSEVCNMSPPSLTAPFTFDISNTLWAKRGFPGVSVVKNPLANTGDAGLIPGLGRSPGDENGNPLQYSWLQNPMNREAWWASVHSVSKSQT